jgi:nitroreductase
VDTFETIRSRRSSGLLVEPAPTREELRVLFEAAVYAPDHKELHPWRFIVLEGAAKTAFGDHLANALVRRSPATPDDVVEKERVKLGRAPVVIVVACKRLETKLPFEELFAAVAAATQNLLLAATDIGYGTMWRTGDAASDPNVKKALGLDVTDAIVGFVYVGTPAKPVSSPKRVRIDDVVTTWTP